MEDTRSLSGYILGIVALVLAFFNPFPGLILGIVSLVQCSKQNNKYSSKGKVMSIIAIIISVIFIVIAYLVQFKVINIPGLSQYV